MLNPLLQNQVRLHFGNSIEMPDKFMELLNSISDTYDQFETLAEENSELKKTNEQLDHFVYSVSHDLRAPLSSMKGLVEITEEETAEPVTLEHMKLLLGSIGKLDHFILDVLDYCRSKRLEIKPERIDFKELIENISDNLRHMNSGNRNVDIKISITQYKEFCSDKIGVGIVLNNLVSNAIRYQNPMSEQPFVDIEVEATDKTANIIVKDNGIGISKEGQTKIFDMFYRVSDETDGTGLGLFLVKETIEKLNGKINVESELGKGSVFQILIPNNVI
ncbi:MAG: HAMP domain-containing histidine kinase [Bacteroidetes bacterium]|nr:HAMP domain-containing histidine kinase [Bacteroidota bacterium]